MTPEDIKMHLAAGRYYGKTATCGKKIRHDTEEKAQEHADHLNRSSRKSHTVEAYPCYWCSDPFPETDPVEFTHLYWHVGREMTEQEKAILTPALAETILEMEEVVIHVAEPEYGAQIGERTLRVHNRKLCAGQFCSIHNPSDHHMKNWTLNWRGDRGIMERFCPHGIGHPDPDDADYRRRRDGENADPGIHGCDGCCSRRNNEQNT